MCSKMMSWLTHPTAIALAVNIALFAAVALRDMGWPPLHDLSVLSWLIIALGYTAAMTLAGHQAQMEDAWERQARGGAG
jgi:hypothetical protein